MKETDNAEVPHDSVSNIIVLIVVMEKSAYLEQLYPDNWRQLDCFQCQNLDPTDKTKYL